MTARAVAAVRALATAYPRQGVVAASHSTLIARALGGLGVAADWAFERRMPMPAVYRLRFTDPSARPMICGPHLTGSAHRADAGGRHGGPVERAPPRPQGDLTLDRVEARASATWTTNRHPTR